MDQISRPFSIFLSASWKNWLLSRGYFGSLGHTLGAIGIIERFKQESLYGLFARTKKVATVERLLLVEVPLYSVETISITDFTVIISNL